MINKLLEQHYYNGKIGVLLITQNRTMKPSDMAARTIYAKYQLMPLRNRMGTLCSIEQSGILQITLFVDVAIGTDLIDQKAQAIVNHFGTEKSHTLDMSDPKKFHFADKTRYANILRVPYSGEFENFMIMSSTANAAMPDGTGKFMMPITIEYRVV